MSVIKNINSANVCTFGNKGVNTFSAVLDSLMKKDRKNTANYLVVPNICILSLSLSLVEQAQITHFFFSRTRARNVPQTL